MHAAEQDPFLGQLVGSYRIERLIGSGGMGRVYVAVHPEIGSRVAIKVLSQWGGGGRPELVARFFDEARMVGRIRHDGIVRVLDLARLPDGSPVIVMDLLDGEPLSRLVARIGRLHPAEVVRIGVALLDALEAAHAAGVIHRDLKPDNVFVTAQGRVVVLDFGIAKLVPELSGEPGAGGAMATATTTGSLVGTPAFMSPEQILGRSATAATDVYAVGVIVYQALAGRLPFDGASLFELLQKHVSAAPPPLPGDVPWALAQVVERALRKEPGERFASAGAMAAAMVQAMGSGAGAGVAPVPVQAVPRKAMWPWVAALGLVIVSVIVIVIVIVMAKSGSGPTVASGLPDAGPAPSPSPSPTPTPTPTPTPNLIPIPSPSPSPSPSPKKPSTAVTHMGGVTIINTADLAREKTGLDKIVEKKSMKNFDPIAYAGEAQAMARRLFPDAGLTMISVEWMNAKGQAILTDDHDVTYFFRSKTRSARPAGVPQNVEIDIPCMVHVTVEIDGVAASPVTDEECDAKILGMPRCRSGAGLWKKAFPSGPPKPGDWAAKVSLLDDGWFFSVPNLGDADDPTGDFDVTLPDDC